MTASDQLENALNKILADMRSCALIEPFPSDSNEKFASSSKNQNLINLKNKVESFVRQYPHIIDDIWNHFYEDFMEYTIKCIFDPSFTRNHVNRTYRLFKKFFNENENHVKVIFNYFYDEVKPLILENYYGHLKNLHGLLNFIPKVTADTIFMIFLKNNYASKFLTSLMYPAHMLSVRQDDENISTGSLKEAKLIFLTFFFLFLCAFFGFGIFRLILDFFIVLICILFTLYIVA